MFAGGLSMEQRKRLTIAVELVTDPRLLFLDGMSTSPTLSFSIYSFMLQSPHLVWTRKPP